MDALKPSRVLSRGAVAFVSSAALLLTVSQQSVAQNAEIDLSANQPQIVGGKALSFALSTAEEMAVSPPGKWVNIFGMVYFRYIERGTGSEKESVEGLVKTMADGAADILTAEQFSLLVDIASSQYEIEAEAMANRESISRALYEWTTGPDGDREAIQALAFENGELLFEALSQRAEVFGDIYRGLSDDQRADLNALRDGTYEPSSTDIIGSVSESQEEQQELNLLAGKFATWATSTESMNRVVDEGRPAVFFGFANLRIENREGEAESDSIRRDAAAAFYDVLTPEQTVLMEDLVVDQEELIDTYVDSRGDIASAFMGTQIAPGMVDLATLEELCILSEVVEADLAILQAERMGEVVRELTETQLDALWAFKEGTL